MFNIMIPTDENEQDLIWALEHSHLTPIFWDEKFLFVYYGDWLTSVHPDKGMILLDTICLLKPPILDNQDGSLVF